MATSGLQAKVLRRASTPEEFRVYRAGLEWDLVDPIVIEKREDVKSEYRWRDRLKPFNHQVKNLITFCRRLPVTLIADEVGLGKTISAGLILSELMSRSRLSHTLVVCPKLLGAQWKEELESKFDIPSEVVTGADLLKAKPEKDGAIITTYDSARRYLRSLPRDRFEMLVLDEAHKLRNLHGTGTPPIVATVFREALEQRRFRYVLMLTATPIQNRLWDLYSLIDLLTVACGHTNPLGSPVAFVSKYVSDGWDQARHLNPSRRDEFRSIVYGYLSRVRRADAGLYFPKRDVQTNRVVPTDEELALIRLIARPVQGLNRLAQISILQALTSSPRALLAQLRNMAANGTVAEEHLKSVAALIEGMPPSAKLQGLDLLVRRLEEDNPKMWRAVVFTQRTETQAYIQSFLEERGIRVGTISGKTGPRNQETLASFRRNPPDYHVLVSTETGSEGINLQVANVVVNYDLPWNPMVVEQRIGRVQRLASEFARVAVFNVILGGTFEEYIVARLMEKLQMASEAIGDVEALLSTIEDEEGGVGFEERIRRLVIASLEGKDVRQAMLMEEWSIASAKISLETNKKEIETLLGGMDGAEYAGPRPPKLPAPCRSMEAKEFVLAAFASLGARVSEEGPGVYSVLEDGRRRRIYLTKASDGQNGLLYVPGSDAFGRLVERVTATGVHDIEDLDHDAEDVCRNLVYKWVQEFGATPVSMTVDAVKSRFEGTALVRVRATVAHDSYERLVEVPCSPQHHEGSVRGLVPVPAVLEDPAQVGINMRAIEETAERDEYVSEFRRFYLNRREEETRAAGDDEAKRKKLEDEFTPRLEMSLVALSGRVHRKVEVTVRYRFEGQHAYASSLKVVPRAAELGDTPDMGYCSSSNRRVPVTCLDHCAVSGRPVLRHLLAQSEVSSRLALPEYTTRCALSGKLVLKDEVEPSAMTGRLVASSLLKTSAASGKRAEPEFFGRCEFTGAEVLRHELAVSEISGKRYRADEAATSSLSAKTGHRQEFVVCYQTRQPLARVEAERCEVTGAYARPGVLQTCEVTGKRVIPEQLLRCSATGKKAFRGLFVKSSLSGADVLEAAAVRSANGLFCTPAEARPCVWSGSLYHPDDLRTCGLTKLPIHLQFAAGSRGPHLQPLADMLDGTLRTSDQTDLWKRVELVAERVFGRGHCRVEAATLSPDGLHLASCLEVRSLLGLRKRTVGLVYSLRSGTIVGRVAVGRRTRRSWVPVD